MLGFVLDSPKWKSVHKTGGKNSTSHVDHHVTYGNAPAWHIPHFQTHPMVGTSAPTRTSLAHRPQSLAQHCVRMHVFQSRLPCQLGLRNGAGITQHDSARLDLSGSSVSNFFHIIFTCWDRWTLIAWSGGLGIVRLVGRLAITGLRQRGLGVAVGCFSMGFKWFKHGNIESMMNLMVISWDVNRIYSLVMTNSLLLSIAI